MYALGNMASDFASWVFGSAQTTEVNLEEGFCVTATDLIPAPPGGRQTERVAAVQKIALRQKDEILRAILDEIPKVAIDPTKKVTDTEAYMRKMNNYLLQPDTPPVRLIQVVNSNKEQINFVEQFAYNKTAYQTASLPNGAEGTTAMLTKEGMLTYLPGAELNCDTAVCSKEKSAFTIAFADGSGFGERALHTAQVAANAAHVAFSTLMEQKPAHTLQDVAQYHLTSIDRAQAALVSLPLEQTSQTTLQLVTLVDSYLVSTQVGDSKVLVTRKQKYNTLTCFDPADSNPGVLESAQDPGGVLGSRAVNFWANDKQEVRGADLRNLRVSILKVQDDDVIHVMSDGTYGCFDPRNLGVKPHDADPALKCDTWNDSDPTHLQAINKFMRNRFAEVIKNQTRYQDIDLALSEYVQASTQAHKLAKLTGQKDVPPGIPDHANSVHLRVKW